MDRLNLYLLLAVGSAIPGVLVIIVLSLGYYAWAPIIAAVVLGVVVAVPVCYLISRQIKHEDPDWDTTTTPEPGPMPRPGAPEL